MDSDKGRQSAGTGHCLIGLRILLVFLESVREAETLEGPSLETRQGGKRFDVVNSGPLVFYYEQIVVSELAQCPVDVRDAETEGITDQLLGKGYGERAALRQSDNLQSLMKFEHEVGDAFEGGAPSQINEVLGVHRRLAGKRPKNFGRRPGTCLEQGYKSSVGNRREHRVGQSADRI